MVVGTFIGVGVDVRKLSAACVDSTTSEENVTTSASVSASVTIQLGDDPRYFARISKHIKADCAMPKRS